MACSCNYSYTCNECQVRISAANAEDEAQAAKQLVETLKKQVDNLEERVAALENELRNHRAESP